MIVPIGNSCMAAMGLKKLNIRKCSYPFDWVFFNDNYELGLQIVYDCLKIKMDEVDIFCESHFDYSCSRKK